MAENKPFRKRFPKNEGLVKILTSPWFPVLGLYTPYISDGVDNYDPKKVFKTAREFFINFNYQIACHLALIGGIAYTILNNQK